MRKVKKTTDILRFCYVFIKVTLINVCAYVGKSSIFKWYLRVLSDIFLLVKGKGFRGLDMIFD